MQIFAPPVLRTSWLIVRHTSDPLTFHIIPWDGEKEMEGTYGSMKGHKDIMLLPNARHLFSRENGGTFPREAYPPHHPLLLGRRWREGWDLEYEIWRRWLANVPRGCSPIPLPWLLSEILCILDQSIHPHHPPLKEHPPKTCMSVWAWNVPLEASRLDLRWWNI